MLTRRRLLGNALKISAGLLAQDTLGFADTVPLLALGLAKAEAVSVPANFTGLGYEMSSVAPLGLLSADNHRYVELIKGLGPAGVLRVGGIVANYTRYEPSGTIRAERQDTVITHASLEQFSQFLKKIGWRAIWSVNFALGSIEEAQEEARAVASILGPRLLALEIGNEVENYFRGQKPFRPTPYDYETYRKEYNQWSAAIAMAVPGIHFAAPDTASNVEWVEHMAKDAHGDVQLLTTHYYRGGQNRGSAEQLLHPDPRLKDVLTRLRTASQQSGISWRMCETSSFSGGGLKGVSDTMIGALWTLDYMLLLAQYGCAGVDIETGVNQLGFISPYSPVQDDGHGVNSAGVPYYGMLAFSIANRGCTEAMMVEVPESTNNITAYALGKSGKVRSAVLINRGESDARVSVAGLGLNHRLTAMRLLAPSGDSKTDVTFAGASVDADGKWTPARTEHVLGTDVPVPKMTAVVVRS
jgi:hypothetical protein